MANAKKKTTVKNTVKPAAKTPAKKAATKKSAAPAAPKKRVVTADERHKMVETAAYYRAQRHGWQVDPHQNWIEAAKEVDDQVIVK